MNAPETLARPGMAFQEWANPPVTIVGAGMAGLLACRILKQRSCIVEKQETLPNNHTAVLRFRTSRVGDVLGIPFREVSMLRAVAHWKNPVADALAYSAKNLHMYRSDRTATEGTRIETRYVAPDDLIPSMREGLDITFGWTYDFNARSGAMPVISTIPMPALMSALNYPQPWPFFRATAGVNIRCLLRNTDAFVSLLVPDPKYVFSRISITGDELIIEIPGMRDAPPPGLERQIVAEAMDLLGMPLDLAGPATASVARYEKIAPIEEEARRDFIYWATDKHNIYSLGRFATWRPHLLADDLINDIRLIEGWIGRKDRYNMAQHREASS